MKPFTTVCGIFPLVRRIYCFAEKVILQDFGFAVAIPLQITFLPVDFFCKRKMVSNLRSETRGADLLSKFAFNL